MGSPSGGRRPLQHRRPLLGGEQEQPRAGRIAVGLAQRLPDDVRGAGVGWLDALVRRLTDRHGAAEPSPWTVDDAPPAFVAGQLRAIVGVELVITRGEAKVKMSQNRPPADVDGVVAGLAARGDQATADAVRAARR